RPIYSKLYAKKERGADMNGPSERPCDCVTGGGHTPCNANPTRETRFFLTGRVEGRTVWDCLLRSSVRFPGRGRKRMSCPKSRPRQDLGQIVSAPLAHPPAPAPTKDGT